MDKTVIKKIYDIGDLIDRIKDEQRNKERSYRSEWKSASVRVMIVLIAAAVLCVFMAEELSLRQNTNAIYGVYVGLALASVGVLSIRRLFIGGDPANFVAWGYLIAIFFFLFI